MTEASNTNGHGADLNIAAAMMDAVRKDSLQNLITGLGVDTKDARISTTPVRRAPFQPFHIDTLYEQNDIFPLIVDRLPEHATRRWIRMTGAVTSTGKPDKDFGRKAIEALEELDTQQAIFDLYRLHRKDGGSAILLGVNDGNDLETPLNLETVQTVDFLHVLTRAEFALGDIDKNPRSKNFRRPEFYTLSGDASVRVHHTRIIRLANHMVSNDGTMSSTGGWDNPVIERVWEPLRQFCSLFGYVEGGFQDIQQTVMQIDGLSDLLASDVGRASVIARVQAVALMRSMYNIVLTNEEEKYERRGQGPTNVDPILLRSMDRLAGASETPLSIIFGQAPTGLSTDDLGGRKNWNAGVGNKQNRLLRKPVNRVLDAVIAAKRGPFKGRAPKQWSFEFLPLEEESATDVSNRRKIDTETEAKLMESGVLDPTEVRGKYANDPECPWPLSDEITDALEAANDPLEPIDPDQPPSGPGPQKTTRLDASDIDIFDQFDESKHNRDEKGKFAPNANTKSRRGARGRSRTFPRTSAGIVHALENEIDHDFGTVDVDDPRVKSTLGRYLTNDRLDRVKTFSGGVTELVSQAKGGKDITTWAQFGELKLGNTSVVDVIREVGLQIDDEKLSRAILPKEAIEQSIDDEAARYYESIKGDSRRRHIRAV